MVVEKRDIGINKKLRQYLEEFNKEQLEYRPGRNILLRDKNPGEVIKLIGVELGIEDEDSIMIRWKRGTMEFRRLAAYALTTYCGLGVKEAGKHMNNITASCCARLSDQGFERMKGKERIKALLLGA